ncbi:carbohydrate ABC transporter permease [Clavibacter nebraskensis]
MAVTDRTPDAAATPAAATGDPRLAAALTPLPSRDTLPRRADPDRGRRVRSRIGRALITTLLVAFALLFLYPFAWLLAASLKPRGEVFDNSLWPRTFTPENYVEVWQQLPLLGWMGNSLAIALLSAALVSISSALVAFGFAYFRFPGRRILFGLVLATMMLPGAVTMVPQFLIWKNLGLIGT